MSADSRSTVLKRYQSHASLVGNPRMQSYRKQFSLGPPPLLSCIQSGDERYMMVQKTWAGLSVEPNAFNIDTKGNNEPVDLLKYRCRTRNIERHLQPAYRTMEKGPWSTFDSEIPWNTGSTCQRDFRRSTITQPDLISANQAQALRNRANSQADIRAPLSKNSSAHSNDSAKQPGKEKTAGGHVRDVPPKKRKGIPDVIVVEETSPKKKTKTTNNTIHASTASRQTKHKA